MAAQQVSCMCGFLLLGWVVSALFYAVSSSSRLAQACKHLRERDRQRKCARFSEAQAWNWNSQFCRLLLAKTSHKASPDSRMRKSRISSYWEWPQCHTVWEWRWGGAAEAVFVFLLSWCSAGIWLASGWHPAQCLQPQAH